MAETWPTQLQQQLNEAGFSDTTGPTSIRSENEFGPTKVRRVVTKSVDRIQGTITVTTAQTLILDSFYDLTLNGGVRTFNFVHPRTGVVREFRFTSPPSYRTIGGGYFLAQLEWEVLPN